MIITKSIPFNKEEIEKLKEIFDVYIKTVIDIEKKICSAGMNKHIRNFMDNQKIIIESLAMDLKRVALGLHRGSFNMADRFKKEALKRESELENQQLDNYLKKLLEKTKYVLLSQKTNRAEDTLMYSILFQNFALKKM